MSANLRQRIKGAIGIFSIKQAVYIFLTCCYIAAAIYLVQVVGLSFQQTLSKGNVYSQFFFGILAIFLWGFLIFIILVFSLPLRRLLFRMFGADDKSENQNRTEEEEKPKEETEKKKC